MDSSDIGGHQRNVEITSVISFIEETLKTFKGFGEQLKILLDSNLTHKNLSTPKVYNTHWLNEEMQPFYRKIKSKGYTKDAKENTVLIEEQFFKPRNHTQHKKCPNTELFLVRIFLYLG